MPRILILHAAVGTGHTTAARALADAFRRKQQGDVRVEDILDYGSRLFRTALTRAYLDVSGRAPLLWKVLYESSDQADPDVVAATNALRARIERLPLRKLERFVASYAPDAIVCTHMLPLTVLQRLKRQGALRQPLYCVVTDFMVHSMWINEVVDGYFLASEPTRDAMIARGVPPSILHVTGIPVQLEIAEPKASHEARARRGLPADGPIVTLFGGGIEPRRVRLVVTRLLAATTPGSAGRRGRPERDARQEPGRPGRRAGDAAAPPRDDRLRRRSGRRQRPGHHQIRRPDRQRGAGARHGR